MSRILYITGDVTSRISLQQHLAGMTVFIREESWAPSNIASKGRDTKLRLP